MPQIIELHTRTPRPGGDAIAQIGKGKTAYKTTCTAGEKLAAHNLVTKYYGAAAAETLTKTDRRAANGSAIWEFQKVSAPSANSAVKSPVSVGRLDPEVMAPDEPRKAHTDALQAAGKSISDEQIATALQRADQAAHDYLTQCLLAGATLCAAKAATPHGEWKDRLERVLSQNSGALEFCSVGKSQAYVYMKLWRHFLTDLDAGQVLPFESQQQADQLQDQLLALPQSSAISHQPLVIAALAAWIGDEGSIRGLLDRLGRAEREAEKEEIRETWDEEANAQAKSNQPPDIQTDFMDTLFDKRQGIVTRLRHAISDDYYTTLPKSDWQILFAELEPLYRTAKERAGH